MPTENEYEDALIYISDAFDVIKKVLDERLKNKCIHSKEVDEMLAVQAQFKLLSQIETEIQNNKEGK